MPKPKGRYRVTLTVEMRANEPADVAGTVEHLLKQAHVRVIGTASAEWLPDVSEQQRIIRAHAAHDIAAGIDWNGAAGCQCTTCADYRGMGVTIKPWAPPSRP